MRNCGSGSELAHGICGSGSELAHGICGSGSELAHGICGSRSELAHGICGSRSELAHGICGSGSEWLIQIDNIALGLLINEYIIACFKLVTNTKNTGKIKILLTGSRIGTKGS